MSDIKATTGSLVVGNASLQSATGTWPNQWTWPNTYTWPTTYIHPPAEEYANEVEVDQNDHDATLRFYRRRGTARSFVKEVTVPLGVLEWLRGEQ